MVRFVKRVGLGLVLCYTAASADVMLGAYVPGDGFSRQDIEDFNAVVPKPLSFINLFSSFSHDWDHLYWQSTNIVSEGAMPLISWMPVDLDNPDANILAEIALGQRDAYIDVWGAKLLAWVAQYPLEEQPKILLRFGHEFNGNWYPYGNSPVFFTAAWQHIHDRFEAAGVNQIVEWVWSANNVSVDDFDNITVYYPGSDYVDWTSIDGYNFGSNYTWTDWESFEETYADTYLTLVNNYPEKPILIAEIGSAEETDIPDTSWGQYGDNTDATESKSGWIEDMLFQLEDSFSAVRAVAWFNTNKELGWSVTNEANTGLSAYIAGVASNYFTSEFLTASEVQVESIETPVLPTKLELAASAAAEAYEIAQAEYESVKSRRDLKKASAEAARLDYHQLVVARSNAVSDLTADRDQYTISRGEYLLANSGCIDLRTELLENQTKIVDARAAYLSGIDEARASGQKRLDQRSRYLAKRLVFLDRHRDYQTSRINLIDAVANFEAAKELYVSGSEILVEFEQIGQAARQTYLAMLDTFLVTRQELISELELYNALNSAFYATVDKRNDKRSFLLSTAESIKKSKNAFLNSLSVRNDALKKLVDERKNYLQSLTYYQGVHQAFVSGGSNLSLLDSELATVESEYQEVEKVRSDSYMAMSDANYLVSLEEQTITNHLLLLDDSNGKEKEKSNNGNGNSNNSVDKPHKKLASVKVITKAVQKAMAESKKPKATNAEKLAERKMKYKNMTSEDKQLLKQRKLSTLLY